MVIDIDGLKEVNDTLGHQPGDNLIRGIADVLKERVRATDIVARLSGDEFAVLMPQTDTAGALQLGEDLRAEVAEGFDRLGAGATTISVGITMFGGEGPASAEAVLVAADEAMYRAKEEGRNRIALFYEPEAYRAAAQRAPAASATPSPRPPALATQPIRSLAAGRSSATSCCCGWPRGGRGAAGRRLHRRRRALRDGAGAGPLGGRPGARHPRRARARGRPDLAPRQPLRRLAQRRLDVRVHRAAARRRRRRPGPLHLRDHPRRGSRTTAPRPASPTASPSSAAKWRSTTTAPASAPSTTSSSPLRPDQDRRLLRPRHPATTPTS